MTDQEINEAVARKLGNWCGCGHLVEEHSDGRPFGNGPAVCSHGFCKCEEIKYPDYCHSIEAAWEVVDFLEMRTEMPEFQLTGGKDLWVCQIRKQAGYGNTASMAICLALLKLP